MKKFLKTIGLFLLIFSALSVLLNKIFEDKLYVSGNTLYEQKKDYFLNHRAAYNTIYCGSSRIYRQLNPAVVDSLLYKENIKGFNLAAPATFNPETYLLFEELITQNNLNLKYAFIELHPLAVIAPDNITTLKNYYFADLKFLDYSFNYISHSNSSFHKKAYQYFSYSLTYIIKQISLPKLYDYKNIEYAFPEDYNGFYSLSNEMKSEDIEGLSKRSNAFLNDTTVLMNRIKSSKKWFVGSHNSKVNDFHIKKLLNLIELAKSKGIELFFIIPPRHDNYAEIINIKNSLPQNKVIELANYELFPKLYQSEYSFDIGHLNKKGSNLFSIYFANEFKNIVEKPSKPITQ